MRHARELETVTMSRVRIVSDIDECRELWNQLIPRETISDLWEVRFCFHNQYNHKPWFIVAEEDDRIVGFLPLSLDEEAGQFNYFPGEMWEGKTWLEQNRVIARNGRVLKDMLKACPQAYNLRYLLPVENIHEVTHIVDEVGYLFKPPKYDYSFLNYMKEFSHKSEKRLSKDLEVYKQRNTSYRYNDIADFDKLVDLNLERFGSNSYFFDTRFREGFKQLMLLLQENGWLRLTSIIIDNTIAAVDLGCIYNGTYTLLAGGTNVDYPGIAKLINVHHMQFACNEKLKRVDFLCGDFSWKKLFHLEARPLYMLTSLAITSRFIPIYAEQQMENSLNYMRQSNG
ncbi:MAG: GNAT family N-acetyltransferase [Candidatus Zixiibacteriota bacterium]